MNILLHEKKLSASLQFGSESSLATKLFNYTVEFLDVRCKPRFQKLGTQKQKNACKLQTSLGWPNGCKDDQSKKWRIAAKEYIDFRYIGQQLRLKSNVRITKHVGSRDAMTPCGVTYREGGLSFYRSPRMQEEWRICKEGQRKQSK
jgi:hypothetical protein